MVLVVVVVMVMVVVVVGYKGGFNVEGEIDPDGIWAHHGPRNLACAHTHVER